ncbi:MAG: NAD-dependent epimerase/dehydratase family protein [Anaerolineae bacterium]
MHILVIGGTRFVGRHFVEAARAKGHTITLFNRGKSGADVFPDVETIQGDRDNPADLEKLRDRKFDAVLDTCAYIPRHVRMLTDVIKGNTPHYVFISTVSVYTDPVAAGSDERAPVQKLDDPTVEQVTGETYGGLKVLCEEAARHSGISKVLIIRPGMIVGPYDPTDRFTYWVDRVARGGDVLVPGDSARRVQFIDARDLGEWTTLTIEQGETGIMNAVNPSGGVSWGDWLSSMAVTFDASVHFTVVTDEFLNEKGVTGGDMPFWVPAPHDGVLCVSNTEAVQYGLGNRSIADIARDTLAWSRTRGADYVWKAGLSSPREAELLSAWREQT